MDWSITAAADFGTLLNAKTSIVNGIAYNTLQSRSRNIADTVSVKAECDINSDSTKEHRTASLTVDGWRPVISTVTFAKTGTTGFTVTFNVTRPAL